MAIILTSFTHIDASLLHAMLIVLTLVVRYLFSRLTVQMAHNIVNRPLAPCSQYIYRNSIRNHFVVDNAPTTPRVHARF